MVEYPFPVSHINCIDSFIKYVVYEKVNLTFIPFNGKDMEICVKPFVLKTESLGYRVSAIAARHVKGT